MTIRRDKYHTSYYGHGKLLLTGEYLILDGAWGIGLPCRLGQWLQVYTDPESTSKDTLKWISRQPDGTIWFEGEFDKETHEPVPGLPAESVPVAMTLSRILQTCSALNPGFSLASIDKVETRLEFDRIWGLGSSSTLIYTMAAWAQVDPFELLDKTIGGSGYDVACAFSDQPLMISRHGQKVRYRTVRFRPPFAHQLYFIHLKKKQDTASSLERYTHLTFDRTKAANRISEISEEVLHTDTLDRFCRLIAEHEGILSEILDMPRAGELHFPDFPGEVKSLGAWGGDFVMAASSEENDQVKSYFKGKGYEVVLDYEDLISVF